MKRILCLALALAMALSLSACGGKTGGGSSSQADASGSAGSSGASSSDASSSSPSGASSSAGASASNDDADLEDGDVRIVIPSKLMGAVTQEQLDAGANQDGVKTITLNDDGSVTYVMSKDRQQSMLDEIGASIDATLEMLNGEGSQPSVVSVEANDDYSVFTVTLDTETVGTDVSFMAASLFNLGDTYQAFSGKGKDVIVKYVNEASGNVIQESSSKPPQ